MAVFSGVVAYFTTKPAWVNRLFGITMSCCCWASANDSPQTNSADPMMMRRVGMISLPPNEGVTLEVNCWAVEARVRQVQVAGPGSATGAATALAHFPTTVGLAPPAACSRLG